MGIGQQLYQNADLYSLYWFSVTRHTYVSALTNSCCKLRRNISQSPNKTEEWSEREIKAWSCFPRRTFQAAWVRIGDSWISPGIYSQTEAPQSQKSFQEGKGSPPTSNCPAKHLESYRKEHFSLEEMLFLTASSFVLPLCYNQWCSHHPKNAHLPLQDIYQSHGQWH